MEMLRKREIFFLVYLAPYHIIQTTKLIDVKHVNIQCFTKDLEKLLNTLISPRYYIHF